MTMSFELILTEGRDIQDSDLCGYVLVQYAGPEVAHYTEANYDSYDDMSDEVLEVLDSDSSVEGFPVDGVAEIRHDGITLRHLSETLDHYIEKYKENENRKFLVFFDSGGYWRKEEITVLMNTGFDMSYDSDGRYDQILTCKSAL
jgi:hypothetical protein